MYLYKCVYLHEYIQRNIIITIIRKKMVCRGQLGITTVNNMQYNLSFLFDSCVGRTDVHMMYILL